MPHDLCILVCPYFEKEIRKISSGAGLENAVLDVYPSECGGPPPAPPSGEGSLNRPSECGGPPPEWKEIAAIVSKYPECKAVRILGSRCLRKLKNPPENLRHCRIHPLNHCFHMFADSSVIDDYIRRGYYLMTPGILQQWRKKIQQGDFDRKDTGKFSGGNFSALLLADTLVCPDIPLHLETFADVVGRPFEILPAGTDFFRLFLSEIRLQWLLEQEKKQSQQALNQAREQTAEYALAMDMLKNLSLKKNEDEAIGDIMDIFTMLFAPGEISYLSVNDGSPGKIFRSASGSSADEAELRDRLMKLDQDYAWTESESGWRLRIRCRNQILGILEADRLAFPEHRKRYLDLAITVAGICGLVIENARIYRNILLMNRDLEKARVLAEEGKRAKSEFIANMSHEIRTPLNAILGFADIMDKKIRDEQLRDYLANIRSGGKALLVLLNDILELSKIESGKMPIACQPVSVPGIFKEIKTLFMPQISEKGLRFFLDTAADIP
ncbi:MAG: histidine kinase dimerization/phospho-acceptor domain-containing protein, partial [Desulfococcaceae bacterium]|nr:histidine kinase dimerization/phospho-acceptor domain-containing protein [Desulfococcaceae bacterium]